MNDLTLYPADLAALSVAQLAALPPEQKAEIGRNLDEALAWLKQARAKFDAALDAAYGEQARAVRLHPTMKPVELVERAIRNSSRPGDVVLDPFGGSGTTLIAAEKSGRKARLIELDPKYVDVIVRRWQDWTGQQATREADGVAFDQAASDSSVIAQ